MSSEERWGTMSVKDHIDPRPLIADVLLYDRLVFPTPTGAAEWNDWKWEPDILQQRLQQLGELAVARRWDQKRRSDFATRWAELSGMREDANRLVQTPPADQWMVTRLVLAQETVIQFPEGVDHVFTVAAYRAVSAFKHDFSIDVIGDARQREKKDALGNLTFLLGQRFLVPDDDEPEEALKRAIELSRGNQQFQARRRELIDWQNHVVTKILDEGMTPEAAVTQMGRLVDGYNDCVKKAVRKRRWKIGFMVAGVGGSLAGAVFNPLALTGAFLSVAQFTKFDSSLDINAGENAPAAAVHMARKSFGWK
jgi:hypothetical protein